MRDCNQRPSYVVAGFDIQDLKESLDEQPLEARLHALDDLIRLLTVTREVYVLRDGGGGGRRRKIPQPKPSLRLVKIA